ncbi:MAG: hypothetical protein WBC06_07320 [Chitinophagaceae bacterium]
MKKLLLLFAISFLLITVQSKSQTANKTLKKVIELIIPREGGANAASVVWHPIQKKYYAAMAGNANFCIGVFDIKGKMLSPISQKAFFDIRGLWYNPTTKTIQMNGYNDFGWAEYKLDIKGMPVSVKTLFKGMNQPDEQTVGAYNPVKKELYFTSYDGGIESYDTKSAESKDYITLHLGIREENQDEVDLELNNEEVIEDYNSTSVIYTGIKGSEIGLLNYINKEIELYDINSGFLTKTLVLPDDAPTYDILNFAYTNSIYWLFDAEKRIWKGYK